MEKICPCAILCISWWLWRIWKRTRGWYLTLKIITLSTFPCVYPHEEPAHHSDMRIALTWKCVKSHKLLSKKGKNIFYFVSSENHSGTHRFFFEKMHGTLAIFEHQFILLFRHAHVLIFPISIFSWVYTECVCYTLISFHNSTPLIKLMKHYSVERLVFFFPDTAASPSHISCCCRAASGTAWRHTFSFFPLLKPIGLMMQI